LVVTKTVKQARYMQQNGSEKKNSRFFSSHLPVIADLSTGWTVLDLESVTGRRYNLQFCTQTWPAADPTQPKTQWVHRKILGGVQLTSNLVAIGEIKNTW